MLIARGVDPKTEAQLREHLAILEQFQPGTPTDRLNGHVFEVYKVRKPKAKRLTKGRTILIGELEQVFAIDLGRELSLMAEKPYKRTLVRENGRFYLGNGNYIEGGRVIKRELCKTPNIMAAEDFLDISFDFIDGNTSKRSGAYLFGLKPANLIIPAENPIEYHITKYLSIGEKFFSSSKRVVRGVFRLEDEVISSQGIRSFFEEN